MKLLEKLFILLCSCIFSVLFFQSSFSVGLEAIDQGGGTHGRRALDTYKAQVIRDDSLKFTLKKTKIHPQTTQFAKWESGYIEFWRLTSAFLSPDATGKVNFSGTYLSGKTIVLTHSVPTIVSMYDPFSKYYIASNEKDFSLEQMTNGSFYIGREADGTVSVYAIDAVGRLEFRDNWVPMTDMVLFPGMYIRFDPKQNAKLQGADLFRIMIAMLPDGKNSDTGNTTGIEYINLRVNNIGDQDTFFMYRLPIESRTLFRNLHLLFSDHVKKVDLYRTYSDAHVLSSEMKNNWWVVNPGKKNYYSVNQLKWLLAQTLRTDQQTDKKRLKEEIWKIYAESKNLSQENATRETLEQFLVDGRFALFSGEVNSNFSEIYHIIADIIEITPKDTKMKMFQKLSDIYSKNIISTNVLSKKTDKAEVSLSQFDANRSTALELIKTLESKDIRPKDYFDIALYAYSVFHKTETQDMKILDTELYSHYTYELLKTVFYATKKYSESIDDADKQKTTFRSINLQFYHHLTTVLVRSLYDTFMEVHPEDGILVLKENFYDTRLGVIKDIDPALIDDIRWTNTAIQSVFEDLVGAYDEDQKNQTFLATRNAAVRLRTFVNIIESHSYEEYLLHPVISEPIQWVHLPKINASGSIIVYSSK
jgi:hypothetical protein